MPILLDDIGQSMSKVKIYSPKFFDSKFTGSGKKAGLLNESRNPTNIDPKTTTTDENINTRKRKYTNGQTEVSLTPVNILTADAWSAMKNMKRPDVQDMVKIATNSSINTDLYLYMPVHSLVLNETPPTDASGSIEKTLTVCYQMFLYAIADINDETHEQMHYTTQLNKQVNTFHTDFSCNPMHYLSHVCNDLTSIGYNTDNQAIIDFIGQYELYNGMCKRSEEWQTTVDKTLDMYFENISKNAYNTSGLRQVETILRHIQNYNIPLDLYKAIYKSVQTHFQPNDATRLCKQNLNLMLSDTMNSLDQSKKQLSMIPASTPQVETAINLSRFSKEQQAAITSTEPLVLVQAGAGTGKSTVILGRIDYMIASGINPADITVLSFTNAAADNISAKNPNIHSMTISRMVHNIYSMNFPHHELSSIETVMNSLDIYYPDNDLAAQFRRKLYSIMKNEPNGFTTMNNFIEYHYDDVIEILDTIKQTTLELEIIICYQKIDQFVEPADVASRYLIIDEVQDNSIFDFIYALKYVDKHKESLFIVGDSSQTLYEFRGSNPKALNVLEGSGVFATYQLQVNYRSNQEILDFANIALRNIEANQYAHIQLQANSLSPVTEQSFVDKVNFKYHRLSKISDFNDALSTLIAVDTKPYIDAKLAANEKVAFLAFTRNHVYKIQAILEKLYPNKRIVNLVPEKVYNSTIFSEFIKRYWNQMQFVPSQNITSVILQDIMAKLPFLVSSADKAQASVQKMIGNWQAESQALITSWYNQTLNGQMSKDDFLKNVKECMLQFEIRNNAVKQALLSARNEENKKNQSVENADIILSTVHSAKGLEFDNVVVIYRNENALAEDKKRMYYVAFTRAMKSEYILAYDTVASPQIEADYNQIIKTLQIKTAKANGTFVAATSEETDE